MVFKKIIFQNGYVPVETPLRPPPLHGKYHLIFPFDCPHTSLGSFIAPIFLDSPIFSLWPIVVNIWKPRSLAYTVGLTTQKPLVIDAGFGKTIVDTQGKKVNTWSLQCIKQMLRYYNFKVSAGNPFFSFHFVRENIYNKCRESLIMTRPPLPWFHCLSVELTMRNIFETTARGRSRGLWCEVSWEAQDVESDQFTLCIDPNTTTATTIANTVENVSKRISLWKQSPADFSTGWRAFSRLGWQCHRFEQSFVSKLIE